MFAYLSQGYYGVFSVQWYELDPMRFHILQITNQSRYALINRATVMTMTMIL